MTIVFLIFSVCLDVALAAIAGVVLLICALICRIKTPDKRKHAPSFYLKRGMIVLIVPLIILAGIGIYKGYKAIKYASYETVLDMWRDGEGGYGKEGMRLVKDVLSAADKGDRELLVKHFSDKIRGRKDFDQMIDRFLEDYPGDLSDLEIEQAPSGGPSAKGEPLDGGGYITSEFKKYVIKGDGRWYYLYVSFVDYTRLAEEYIGINRICLQNAGARATYNQTGQHRDDSDIICEIEDFDPRYVKIIHNEAYVWDETDEPLLTREEINDLIVSNNGDASKIVEQLGRPNSVYETDYGSVEYFYKMKPEGDRELFLRVYVSRNWSAGGIVVYDSGSDFVDNLLIS